MFDKCTPEELAWQSELAAAIESAAGKVRPELVMTLLVSTAGAVGRGAGVTFDDAGLRKAYDHGFNATRGNQQ